jgi:hypothetical protein
VPFATGAAAFERVKIGVDGTWALKVTATKTTTDIVGMTQNTAGAGSVAGKSYTATCYVRPSTSGLEVRMGLEQYATDFSAHKRLALTTIDPLTQDTWNKISVTGTADTSGRLIIPQIYASFQTSTNAKWMFLLYDNCSLS